MKASIYIRDGETVARVRTGKPRLQPGDELSVSCGNDGEFGEWQIADVLARLQENQNRKAKWKALQPS